jgi:hypothetical protein
MAKCPHCEKEIFYTPKFTRELAILVCSLASQIMHMSRREVDEVRNEWMTGREYSEIIRKAANRGIVGNHMLQPYHFFGARAYLRARGAVKRNKELNRWDLNINLLRKFNDGTFDEVGL